MEIEIKEGKYYDIIKQEEVLVHIDKTGTYRLMYEESGLLLITKEQDIAALGAHLIKQDALSAAADILFGDD